MTTTWLFAACLAVGPGPTSAWAAPPSQPAGPARDIDPDRPTDAVAPPSSACLGESCARIDGDWLRFDDGRLIEVPSGADRLALGSGGWAAFVAPRAGFPAVHVVSPDGSVQALTNRALVRTPGQAPEGFVPPPVREGDLRFEGHELVWDDPEGRPMAVAVPGRAPEAP